MNSYGWLLGLGVIIVLVSSSCCTAGKPLSTVFVLETSDSSAGSESLFQPPGGTGSSGASPASSEVKARSVEEPHTQIITDDGSSNSATNNERHQANSPANNKHSAASSNLKTQSSSQSTNERLVDRELSSSQKVDEESQLHSSSNQPKVSQTRNVNPNTSNNGQQKQQQAQNKAKSTTASPHDSDGSTPKTEERLLISITSNEDDDDYRPPAKQVGFGLIPAINSVINAGSSHSGSSSHGDLQILPSNNQQQKRKPSITISIQDPNMKQNGGTGTQAVIVRPSENGQSIVISTVGGSAVSGSGGTSYNLNSSGQHKPSISVSSSSSHNNDPYREPVNNPNSGHAHHTTPRPSLVNDYTHRPATSTLIDHPSRPVNVADERPHRPVSIPIATPDDFDSRPTSRPTSSNYGHDDDSSRPASGQSESRYPLNERNCGLVHETKIVGGEEANPDDFLWMAAIIKAKSSGEARPFCGGSLITRRHILTAAHCLENLAPRDVLVRLGSYDFDDATASSYSADYAIDQFRVPASYSKKTHASDIAIMRLKTPLATSDNYKTVCMPQARRSYVGALGTVTGYGSQSQTFQRATPKLRQVTVPIWENRKCSVVYKKNLTESFLCAGYEEGGKDACQGDSGGPLMTDGPNERMMVVGVVSHGIGCGAPGYPGVYTRTTTYLDWIEKNTRE